MKGIGKRARAEASTITLPKVSSLISSKGFLSEPAACILLDEFIAMTSFYYFWLVKSGMLFFKTELGSMTSTALISSLSFAMILICAKLAKVVRFHSKTYFFFLLTLVAECGCC